MAINLQKGQRINLTKEDPSLSLMTIGLGWDPVQQGGKGLFAKLKSGNIDMDCDASVFMLNSNGKIDNKKDIIYFGNLKSECGSVVHTGDNLTGEGEGDDEQLILDLSKVPQRIQKLVFVVNIYDCVRRKQHFGLVENCFIRIVNNKNGSEILRYNLSDNYSGNTALTVAEIYRQNNEWKFGAIGQGTNDTSLNNMVKNYL